MNWWHYLILANLYLALFYGFYLLLLRKETYFMLNRVYLVSAAVLSFFIPMIQSEWVKNLFITQKVQRTIYYIDPGFIYQVSPQADQSFTMAQLFTALYWAVAMLLLARLFYRFVKLKRLMQREEAGQAFSFFGQIRVDDNLPQKEVIQQHEQLHAEHYHSADVLLFEALTILNWFNPVIYFYRKSIKHNHEFMADKNAILSGADKSDYAMLLFSQTMQVQPNTLVNSFFNQSLLKQRILMLHKNPSKKSALLKYGLSAPLFGLMLIFTSATVSKQETIKIISDKINSDAPIREVAVDLSRVDVLPSAPAELKLPITIVQKLKGKVVGIDGEPLAGVSVAYTKKNSGFITDKEGNFTISNYIEGDLLTFEYIGYNKIAKSFASVKGKFPVVVMQGNNQSLTVTRGTVSTFTNITQNSNDTSKAVSFTAVEKLPSFPGGEKAFGNYLAKSIRYPKEARDQKITGRVIVTFVVEKDGKLTSIRVLRDIGGGAGAESVRVLEESPAWNPGIQDGKPVRVTYTMPVNFTLAGDSNRASNDSTKKTVSGITITRRQNSSDTTKLIAPSRVVMDMSNQIGISDPIYILDGKEIDKTIMQITNPNDIESISVLKGKSAITKYGDKGKNGAVEITTKKGKKP